MATALFAAGGANAAAAQKNGAAHPIKPIGAVNLGALAAAAKASSAASATAPASQNGPNEYRFMPNHRLKPVGAFRPLTAAEALAAPHEGPVGFSDAPIGFRALDHYDQRIRADNGNQFSLEPPDQALAVGAGKVLEVVNDVLMVYDPSGNPLLPAPVSTNKFFLQFSAINRTTGERGPFLSDPRAYYDASTGRFFVVEWATLNDTQGNPLNISVQFFAVSQTSDPTGSWFIYNFETTHQGLAGCPCIPDFQQLGLDANGMFITHNLFSMATGAYIGASIYALPKLALENGSGYYVEFPVQTNDFTIHPTVVPPGGRFASEANGTEYFVETTDDLTSNGLSNIVNIWAVSGTNTLKTSTPSLSLAVRPVRTQTVSANLVPAIQKDGPRPLGNGLGEPKPKLDAGDGRVGSTPVYLNGKIWAVAGTAVTGSNGTTGDGVAWFQFAASGGAPALTSSITSQGIISPGGRYLLYPAIAMNTAGQGGIGVSVVSPSMYPSTGLISMPEFVKPTVRVVGPGALPDDGFTAYPEYGGSGVGRWGDYGAAAVDEYGDFWFANEYIPPVTPAYPRSALANWGTFITPTE
ncbi:MAG: hypothetical protein JWO83_529 [Caulobacteraceae bacterium]|nr:hypothetical protein [Caulobacteraceae bacterium]